MHKEKSCGIMDQPGVTFYCLFIVFLSYLSNQLTSKPHSFLHLIYSFNKSFHFFFPHRDSVTKSKHNKHNCSYCTCLTGPEDLTNVALLLCQSFKVHTTIAPSSSISLSCCFSGSGAEAECCLAVRLPGRPTASRQ